MEGEEKGCCIFTFKFLVQINHLSLGVGWEMGSGLEAVQQALLLQPAWAGGHGRKIGGRCFFPRGAPQCAREVHRLSERSLSVGYFSTPVRKESEEIEALTW